MAKKKVFAYLLKQDCLSFDGTFSCSSTLISDMHQVELMFDINAACHMVNKNVYLRNVSVDSGQR